MVTENLHKSSFLYGCIFSLLAFSVIYYFSRTENINENNRPHSIVLSTNDQELLLAEYNDEQFNQGDQNNTSKNIDDVVETNNKIITWEAVLTQTLTQQQMLTFSEDIPEKMLRDIRNSNTLFLSLLKQVTQFEKSPQRNFLIQVLSELTDTQKEQAINELIISNRVIDKLTAILLFMSIDNEQYKTMQAQHILDTSLEYDVLETLLNHLNSANNQNVVLNMHDDLQSLYNNPEYTQMKGLILQVIMRAQPYDNNLLNEVTSLVNSSNMNDNFNGLNILNQQLNDFGIELSTEQKMAIETQLYWIANDNTQSIDNRLKALSTLKILADHY